MQAKFELADLIRLAHSQSEEEFFANTIPEPVFYVEHFLDLAQSDSFMTNQGKTGESHRIDLFFPLRKRSGANSFTSMVTVGRAGNNDVVIQGEGVSKFHAYFMRVRSDWTLVDAGSSLGTFVEGHELEPRKERAPMTSGTRIRLGNAILGRYLDPADCLRLLKSF